MCRGHRMGPAFVVEVGQGGGACCCLLTGKVAGQQERGRSWYFLGCSY